MFIDGNRKVKEEASDGDGKWRRKSVMEEGSF